MAKPLDFLRTLREAVTQSATPKYYEVALCIPAVDESLAAFDETLKSVSYKSLVPNAMNSLEKNLCLLKSKQEKYTIILKAENGELKEIFTGFTITHMTQRNGIVEAHIGTIKLAFAMVHEDDEVDKDRVEEYKKNMTLACMQDYLSKLIVQANENYNTIMSELEEKIRRKNGLR